jgi:hypothetical protein
VTNPLFLAGVVIVAGFVGTRYWQPRSSLAYFVIQLAGFVTVTGLLLAGGVVPYRPGVVSSERMRLFVSGPGIIWWLGAAWLTPSVSCVHLSCSAGSRAISPPPPCSQAHPIQTRRSSRASNLRHAVG